MIVWTHDLLGTEMARQVANLGLGDEVYFLRGVSNDDLVLLHNAASLFVFPSLYEGFGLPLLEAMACGTPVLASNNSSIPEIVGEAAVLVEPRDVKTIAVRISSLLTDNTLRAELVRKGHERAAHFSWSKCARQTIAAYRQAMTMSESDKRKLGAYSP